MSKALNLLKSNKSLIEKAEDIIDRIKRDVEQGYIEVLERKIENIGDQISDLSNIYLTSNLNEGKIATSIEDAKKRFASIVELKYQLELTKKELEVKKAIFASYFSETLNDI